MKTKGFTLLEMLSATAVGSVVLLLAVGALSRTGEDYGRTTDSVAADRESRAALNQLVEDLSKAAGGMFDLEEGEEGWRTDRLGFSCLQAPDAQSEDEAIGDLCVTNYYVEDLQVGGETVRCLMRGFRSSSEVFEGLRDGATDSLFAARSRDEPVAFGVVEFRVEGLERQAGGDWKEWKDEDSEDPLVGVPEAVRVKLVVARRELIGKLQTEADWSGSPLIGDPEQPERSKRVEVYEVIQSIGYED